MEEYIQDNYLKIKLRLIILLFVLSYQSLIIELR